MDRGILDKIARTRYGAIENVNSNLVDWREVEGQKGNYIKVLALDTSRHRVDFLFRQDPHAEFAKHNHRCLAIAYTLGGLWGYREAPSCIFPAPFHTSRRAAFTRPIPPPTACSSTAAFRATAT